MQEIFVDAINAIDQALVVHECYCKEIGDDTITCTGCLRVQAARNAMDKLTALKASMPKVVCLCGSTKFMEEFRKQNCRLTANGVIVLSVGVSKEDLNKMRFPLPQHEERFKELLDLTHKRKIDLADEIFVLNVGGYIGSSTRSEIDYARAHGKPVKFLEAEPT